MSRSWPIAGAFAGCALLLLSAMAWITWTALDLEQEAKAAWREAEREGKIRLALWRIDSVLAPLIAAENGRPHSFFTAFYSPGDFLVCEPPAVPPRDLLVASPLLTDLPPHIRLHFQYDAAGRLASPQVPEGPLQRSVCEANNMDPALIEESSRRLARLQAIASRDALARSLPRPEPVRSWSSWSVSAAGAPEEAKQREEQPSQTMLNSIELVARQRAYVQVASQNDLLANRRVPGSGVLQGVMHPLWVGGEFILARRMLVDGAELIQGCWLDWPALERQVLAGVRDLLPDADVVPLPVEGGAAPSRLLVSVPATIVPGAIPDDGVSPRSPVPFSLFVAWCCIVASALAVGALLVGVVALSERRAAFVSAVTHELRTPLTTFRMYTEMLSKGMVEEGETRNAYIRTLSREADRLGHLVDNVLAYARLERRGAVDPREPASLEGIIERSSARLAERAEQGGMTLCIDGDGTARGVRVRADPVSVEQVLLNLVDNACKYAGAAADRRIHLEISAGGKRARLRVRDHGPGIPESRRRSIFRPFSKSASEAARSSPGVGLGLALSRRIARRLGGDLRHERGGEGASFVLELPAA